MNRIQHAFIFLFTNFIIHYFLQKIDTLTRKMLSSEIFKSIYTNKYIFWNWIYTFIFVPDIKGISDRV